MGGLALRGRAAGGFTASRSRVLCLLAGLDERLSPQFRRFRTEDNNIDLAFIRVKLE